MRAAYAQSACNARGVCGSKMLAPRQPCLTWLRGAIHAKRKQPGSGNGTLPATLCAWAGRAVVGGYAQLDWVVRTCACGV